MRTVLVCVRTPLAAQNVASAAARLGLAAAVRTAVSDPEVMLRLAERPPDVVLADTALTRPDSVGFTRRVLARAPGAAILLFGSEEPGMASATIAAGARGLIQGGDHDLVSVVAKALLLLSVRGRAIRGAGRDGAALPTTTAGGPALPPEVVVPARPTEAGGPDPAMATGSAPGVGPADGAESVAGGAAKSGGGAGQPPGSGVVPVQRGDDPAAEAEVPSAQPGVDQPASGALATPTAHPMPAAHSTPMGHSSPTAQSATAAQQAVGGAGAREPGVAAHRTAGAAGDARFGAPRQGDLAAAGESVRAGRGPSAPRQVVLTEREMQVLLGMADGKSNAEIGRELFVSEDTVKTHARRLFRKLGARDRAHAVAAGFRAGLVA